MTALDAFQPIGEPIHPYDMYELLNNLAEGMDILTGCESPSAEDEDDYLRNRHKIGSVVLVNGKAYFQTTSVVPKTNLFADIDLWRNEVKNV